MNNKEVQILVDETQIKLVCNPYDLFSVLKGLISQGKNPQVRCFDEELKDWTCWQPTTKAA